MESCGIIGDRVLVMVERLVFGGWDVAESGVEAAVVPPVDPGGGRELHLLGGRDPRASGRDRSRRV